MMHDLGLFAFTLGTLAVFLLILRRQGSNPVFPPFPEENPKYAFCEGVGANHFSRWHIRKVPDGTLKFGGGITTPSLCGHVRMTYGWDLRVKIDEHHLTHACSECVTVYRKETATDSR